MAMPCAVYMMQLLNANETGRCLCAEAPDKLLPRIGLLENRCSGWSARHDHDKNQVAHGVLILSMLFGASATRQYAQMIIGASL